MSDAGAPLPFPTPPSVSEVVDEHLGLIDEVRQLRREVNQLRVDVARAVNAATTAHLLLVRIAKKLGVKTND